MSAWTSPDQNRQRFGAIDLDCPKFERGKPLDSASGSNQRPNFPASPVAVMFSQGRRAGRYRNPIVGKQLQRSEVVRILPIRNVECIDLIRGQIEAIWIAINRDKGEHAREFDSRAA